MPSSSSTSGVRLNTSRSELRPICITSVGRWSLTKLLEIIRTTGTSSSGGTREWHAWCANVHNTTGHGDDSVSCCIQRLVLERWRNIVSKHRHSRTQQTHT